MYLLEQGWVFVFLKKLQLFSHYLLHIGKGASALEIGAIAMGNNAYATRDYSIAIGGLATATQSGNVAIGDQASATIANSVAIGQGSITKAANENVGKVNINGEDIFLNYAGSASGVVSVGGNGSRQIQKVAAGLVSQSSTDAINGSQLYSVLGEALKGQNVVIDKDGIDLAGGTIDNVADATEKHQAVNLGQLEDKLGALGDQLGSDIQNAGWNIVGVDADGAETTSKITNDQTVAFESGKNTTVSTELTSSGAKVTVDIKDDITLDGEKGGLTVSAGKGKQDITIQQGNVSFGNNQLNNVAAGTVATDAVNVGQLSDALSALGGGAGIDDKGVVQMPEYTIHGQDYTNVGSALDALQQADVNLGDRITDLQQSFNNRIDDVEDRMSAGIAAAMALENAPYIPGKYTYSAATAYHNGQAALGVTLRKTSDNGLWSVTGGVAAGTEGDPSVRLGISGVIK